MWRKEIKANLGIHRNWIQIPALAFPRGVTLGLLLDWSVAQRFHLQNDQ